MRVVPGFAKAIMALQTLIIAFLAFWMYQEYQYNVYFQAYVNSFFQGSGLTIVVLGTVGVFSMVGSGLYLKLRRARRQLEHLASKNEPAKGPTTGILAPHEEQHLMELIRQTTPTPTSSTGGLPILKREEPQPTGNQP